MGKLAMLRIAPMPIANPKMTLAQKEETQFLQSIKSELILLIRLPRRTSLDVVICDGPHGLPWSLRFRRLTYPLYVVGPLPLLRRLLVSLLPLQYLARRWHLSPGSQ